VNESDSSGSGRPAGSDSGRPACDWEAAFRFWASLPPQQRSYSAVAERFAVSVRTVEAHGLRDKWRERLAAIEAEAAAQADAELAQARAEQQIVIAKLADRSFARYGELLEEGAVDVTPADFVRIANLNMSLRAATSTSNQPASRNEIVREVMLELRDVLADHPDAVAALREHFGETTDGD
jgi:uncharacterized RmlC-like cupin family protein